MKRWLWLGMALLLVLPTFAQEEETIAGTVLAAAQGDEPEFTLLLNALLAADPTLTETLNDPDENLTVFAPTDAAFEAWLTETGSTVEDLLTQTDLLSSVLSYHILPDVVSAEDLSDTVDAFVPTLLAGDDLAITQQGDRLLVDGATITETDIAANNGLIHVINQVLVPDGTGESTDAVAVDAGPPTIVQVVLNAATDQAMPEFRILLLALSQANPIFLETLNNPEREFTVFAPTDAAFEAFLRERNVSSEEFFNDTELLDQVLRYHVAAGIFTAETLSVGEAVFTSSEQRVEAGISENRLLLNESAQVITADVEASNGLIHIIDEVLVPPDEPAETDATEAELALLADVLVSDAMPEDASFDILLAALETTELLATLGDETAELTLFAPTDAAMEIAGVTGDELTDLLTAILLNHVAEGTVTLNDMVNAGELPTLGEGTVAILVRNDGVVLNESALIVMSIPSSNGIIHVIDAVLFPPE